MESHFRFSFFLSLRGRKERKEKRKLSDDVKSKEKVDLVRSNVRSFLPAIMRNKKSVITPRSSSSFVSKGCIYFVTSVIRGKREKK